MTINNELLSEVFTKGCLSFEHISTTNNVLKYKYLSEKCIGDEDASEWVDGEINLYEFMHKCKEWIETKGYILLIFGSIVYIVEDTFDEEAFDFYEYTAYTDIFQAIQWLLPNRS